MRTVTITIPVMQAHIQNGMRWWYTKCPVALAIEDRTNLHAHVTPAFVTLRYHFSGDADEPFGGYLSTEVWTRIRRFDISGEMEPFTFPLTLPVVEVG